MVGRVSWRAASPRGEMVAPWAATAAGRSPTTVATTGNELASAAAQNRQLALERLAYAQGWDEPQPAALVAFHDWAQRYRSATTAAARAALEAEGVELARARRPEMKRLIQRDPQRALAATVPAVVRQILPATVLAELEKRVAGTGDYTLLGRSAGADAAAGPATKRVVFLGGVTYRVHAYGRREGQLTKEDASLHGIALDGEFALHESPLRVLEPGEIPAGAAAAQCPVSGETVAVLAVDAGVNLASLDVVEAQGRVWEFCGGGAMLQKFEQRLNAAEAGNGPRVQPLSASGNTPTGDAEATTAQTIGAKPLLVIRVDFSDVPGEPITVPTAQSVLDSGANPFFDSMSYGQTSLVTTVSAKIYRMPQTASFYALTDGNDLQLHTDARSAASADYTVLNYERVIVVFANLGTSRFAGSQMTYGGQGTVGGSKIWINGSASFTMPTVSHELGHTYGLLHANLWKVTDGNPISPAGVSLEYGDPFDDLGSSAITGVTRDSRHHFNPWFKNRLGWLPNRAVTDVTTSGVYRVFRYDSKNASADQPLALRIFRDGVRSYWIGLRQNFDTSAPTANDAYVIWGFNSGQQSALLDLRTPGVTATDAALPIGTTFSDPGYGITIKPVARGGAEPAQWLDVEITVPAAQSNVVAAWGRNGVEFFDGNNVATTPVPETYVPFGLVNVQTIAAGDAHALALKTDGSIVAWGSNSFGQTTVPAGLTGTVAAIAAGGSVCGVVKRDGTVQLWGDTTFGQTVPPAGLANVRQLAIGRNHTLALKMDGTVVAWGSNSSGQATVPAGLSDVVAITAGAAFSVALKSNGTVAVWGTSLVTSVPAGLTGVVAISACGALLGGQFIDALKSDGTVVAWGANNNGQATVTAGLKNVVAIAAGSFHSIALKSDGSIVGWGSNTSSQLTVPPGLPRSHSIAASALSSFALAGPYLYLAGQPQTQVAAIGGSARLYVQAIGVGALSYQWRKNGVAISGATGATLTLTGLTAADATGYDVVVTDAGTLSSVTSGVAALTLVPAGDPGRLINLSILTSISASSPLFTVGTVIGGAGTSGAKPLLIRAAGPALTALGVGGVLADPKLSVFSDQNTATPVATNDNWGSDATALNAAFSRVGAFPYGSTTSKDAATFGDMPAGGYTVQVSGVGGATGTVIAELYDATLVSAFTASTPRLINVSVLKQIDAGEILTVGFVVGGTTSKQVLVRAIGPTLALPPFNVGGTMSDPKLDLFSGQTVINANNNWGGGSLLSSTGASVGAFAIGDATSKDAILLATLAPGAYTVQVSGANGSGGLTLVEVYEVP